MTTPATPRTAAGRALLETIMYDRFQSAIDDSHFPDSEDAVVTAILAIEDESYGNGLVGAQYEARYKAESATPPHDALLAALRALMEATSPAAKRGPLAKARQQARALLRDLSPEEEGQ